MKKSATCADSGTWLSLVGIPAVRKTNELGRRPVGGSSVGTIPTFDGVKPDATAEARVVEPLPGRAVPVPSTAGIVPAFDELRSDVVPGAGAAEPPKIQQAPGAAGVTTTNTTVEGVVSGVEGKVVVRVGDQGVTQPPHIEVADPGALPGGGDGGSAGAMPVHVSDLLHQQAGGQGHDSAPGISEEAANLSGAENRPGAAPTTAAQANQDLASALKAVRTPGILKDGKHSVTTNDQMQKSVFELTKGTVDLNTAGHVNAWSFSHGAGAINPDVNFVDLAAAGAVAGIPAAPVPVPAGATDFAFQMEARWLERGSDGAPAAIANFYNVRVTAPAGTVINNRSILYTDTEFRDQVEKITDQIDAQKATSKGTSVLDTRTIGAAISGLLSQNTFGRATEQMANLPMANRLRMVRVNNAAMYARLLHQATVLSCYEAMGIAPAFNAPAGPIGAHLATADYDPVLANVQINLDILVTAAVTNQITFRVPLDLSVPEADLLASILMNDQALYTPAAGQPVIPFAAVDWQRQAPIVYIKPTATVINWVTAVPEAIDVWRLAEKVAIFRGEVDDYMEGLALANELLGSRIGADLLAPWAPAGSFTSLDTAYSSRQTEMPAPSSMNWISMMLPDNKPAIKNQAEFDFFNALSVEARWIAMGRLTFLLSAATSVAFKEFNAYGVQLEMYSLMNASKQWAGANRLEGQALAADNIARPAIGQHRAPWIYRATEALMLEMYGIAWPTGTHDGKYWCGRNAAPNGVVPAPVAPAVRSAVLYTQLFGNGFPTLNSMVSVANCVREGCIPRNWGFIGNKTTADFTHEIRTDAGAGRGLMFFRGVSYDLREFRSARGALFHSYATRATNTVSLFMTNAMNLTVWTAQVGPGNLEIWVPGAIGGLVVARIPGSFLIPPESLRSFDWQGQTQVSYSLSFPAGAAFNAVAAIFQRSAISGDGYMAFGVVRDYLLSGASQEGAGEEDWGSDLF